MRCSICLSHYAGPLGICTDCLVIAFPHGASEWMAADHRARHPLNGQPVAARLPLR